MKVSTKGQYGVRAMFDLAMCYGEAPVSISKIASNQGISVAYLEQLFSLLKKAGIIRSIRGAQGGFLLMREPKDINIGSILMALEGPMAPVKCVSHDLDCEIVSDCPSRVIWQVLEDRINEVLESISLQDMIDRYNAVKQ